MRCVRSSVLTAIFMTVRVRLYRSPEQSPGRASNIELMSDFPTIRDIATFLEDWAPRASAQPYDNVGLQVGDPTVAVRRALLALDMTPQVLDEAASAAA